MTKIEEFELELVELCAKYNLTLTGGTYGDEVVAVPFKDGDELIISYAE